MADETVKRIKLQIIDEFSRGLDKYQREIGQAATATDDLNKRGGLKQLNEDLGALALKAGVAFAALAGAAKTAEKFSEIGQTALRNRAALEALTDSTEDYEAKVRAVQDATRGLTTESEAAAIAARLQQFGLADSAAEMQRFVDTIVRVGTVNPMLGDTTEAISQIQLTLSNMSFMRLDQLGLSAGAVRARMAELKASTRGLSDEAAFQQAVMEGLAAQADRVTDSMLEIGAAQGRAKTVLREFGDDVGIYLTGRLDEAATSALMLYETLGKLGGGETVVRLAFEVAGLNQEESTAFLARFDEVAANLQAAAMPGVTSNNRPGTLQSIIAPGLPRGIELPGFLNGVMPSRQPTQGTLRRTFVPGTGMTPSTLQELMAERAWAQQYSSSFFAETGASPEGLVIPSFAGHTALTGPSFAMRQQRGMDTAIMPLGAPVDFSGRVSARLPTTGMDFGIVQAVERAASPALDQLDDFGQSQLPGIITGVQNLASAFVDAATGAGEFVTEAEAVGSLNELFGVAPTGLNADIYSRAASAMRDAGLEGDALSEALRVLGLETGVTNVANEVFDARLGDLSQKLSDGTITAAQYVEQIRLLQNQDWGKIQAFADSMDPAKAAEFAAALGAPGGQEAFDATYDKIQGMIDLIKGGGEEEEGAGVFQGMVDDSTTMAEEIIANAGNASREAEAMFLQLTDTGERSFQDLSGTAEEELDKIKKGIDSFHGVTFQFTVSAIAPGVGDTVTIQGGGGKGGGPGKATPQYAEGGYTGDGTQPFMALLHPREVVVPLDKLRGGAGMSMPPIPQMTTAAGGGRMEAETPIILKIGEDEVTRIVAHHSYRTNAGGTVRAN